VAIGADQLNALREGRLHKRPKYRQIVSGWAK
jgi:hypothetical protein